MNVDSAATASPGDKNNFPGSNNMSSADIRSFFFRVGLKADKELERLRPLNPTLNKKQLIAGTYEAIVNHWLEFECPKDPGRKFMEESLIDLFFLWTNMSIQKATRRVDLRARMARMRTGMRAGRMLENRCGERGVFCCCVVAFNFFT
jgi:hypothetical protein